MSSVSKRVARNASARSDAVLDREHFLSHNVASVVLAANKLRAAGTDTDTIVMMVLDVTDPLAAKIAHEVGGAQVVEEVKRRYLPRRIPTLLVHLPLDGAIASFRPTHPRIAAQLASGFPPDVVRIVAMSQGGATLAICPLSYRHEPAAFPGGES